MTHEERQALRQQHYNFGIIASALNGNNDSCAKCWEIYPCDVIKVLDATENLKPNDLKTKVERSKILAVIHAYDETPESKLARIWEVLGRKA